MIDTNGIDTMTIDDDGNIYVAFSEKVTNVNYVKKWDGNSWIEVGGPIAENRIDGGFVSDLQWRNGILYAGRQTSNGLLAFIGNTWTPVGNLLANVWDFGVVSQNEIYVLSGSTVNKWNGAAWSDITPEPGFYTFGVVDDTGRLYIAKQYTGGDGFRVYDAGLWSTLPTAPIESDDVVVMYSFNNKVYVAGWSIVTDEMIVAIYDGSSWSELNAIHTTFPSVAGYEITSLYADSKGVYVTFKDAGANNRVLKWTGLEWVSIGDNLLSPNVIGGIGYMTDFVRGSDGLLIGAGYIHNVDGVVSGNIAKYSIAEDDMLTTPPVWIGLPFPGGLNNPIKASTTDGTNLYVAFQNWYTNDPALTTDGIFVYKFDGSGWSEVGGVGNRIVATSQPTMSPISCMAWNNGKLYLGTFGDNIYKFEGGLWSNLSNVIDSAPGHVQTMAFDDNDPDIIYVGSDSLFRWNGIGWEQFLDTNPNSDINGSYLTAVTDNGNLFVSGYMYDDNLGDDIGRDGYVVYDGVGWNQLGNQNSPIPEFQKVRAMVAYLNDIYVLGKDVNNKVAVAKWDNKEWCVLGDISVNYPDVADGTFFNRGANEFIDLVSLKVDASGIYISAFANNVGRTLRWNGLEWLDIGSPMNNLTGKVFKYINALNTAGIFGDLVKIGTRLYGTGTLTEIDGETAGNVAYREISDPFLERNWHGINLEPTFYGGGYTSFILDNDEVIISVDDTTIATPPYQSRLYRYKDFRFDGLNVWLTPSWEEIGSLGNRPPFGGIKEIVMRNNIIYVLGYGPGIGKYESGIWSTIPNTPPGGFNISDTLEVDSLDRVIACNYENLWRHDGGVWSNLLNVPGYWINARVTSTDTIYAHLRENFGTNSEFRYYNGVSWSSITSPVNVDFGDAVTDAVKFFIYNDEVYTTGYDTVNSTYNVYRWNGSIWSQIGDISSDFPEMVTWDNVRALYVDSGGVYLNVVNNVIGGGSCVIKWNGSNWIKIANVVNSIYEPFGVVCKMERKSNGRLMMVGFFDDVEGIPAKGISRFDVDEVL